MNLYLALIISFFVISILGTLLHFTHGFFKKGLLLHIFSAVNESTAEHVKLYVAPTLSILLFQYLSLSNDYNNIFTGILILMFVEMTSIPIMFESLRIIMKKVPLMVTILMFYLAVLFGLIAEFIILTNQISFFNETIAFLSIMGVVIFTSVSTFKPPRIFLFKDPISSKYGHREDSK